MPRKCREIGNVVYDWSSPREFMVGDTFTPIVDIKVELLNLGLVNDLPPWSKWPADAEKCGFDLYIG